MREKNTDSRKQEEPSSSLKDNPSLKKHFGTDGIRGIPNESLTEEIVSKVCSSVEKILSPKTIALIADTRSSSETIAMWISNGFSQEVTIFNYGILPSGSKPILLDELNHDMGIIISASHNPSEYNGIKLIDKNGSKLSDEVEILIEETMDSIEVPKETSIIKESHLGYENYKIFLDSINDIDFSQFNLVVDSANGAAYKIIEDIIPKNKSAATFIANKPNGSNINERIIRTKNNTGKKAYEYSKIVFLIVFFECSEEALFFQIRISVSINRPLSNVRVVSIRAKFIIYFLSFHQRSILLKMLLEESRQTQSVSFFFYLLFVSPEVFFFYLHPHHNISQ